MSTNERVNKVLEMIADDENVEEDVKEIEQEDKNEEITESTTEDDKVIEKEDNYEEFKEMTSKEYSSYRDRIRRREKNARFPCEIDGYRFETAEDLQKFKEMIISNRPKTERKQNSKRTSKNEEDIVKTTKKQMRGRPKKTVKEVEQDNDLRDILREFKELLEKAKKEPVKEVEEKPTNVLESCLNASFNPKLMKRY